MDAPAPVESHRVADSRAELNADMASGPVAWTPVPDLKSPSPHQLNDLNVANQQQNQEISREIPKKLSERWEPKKRCKLIAITCGLFTIVTIVLVKPLALYRDHMYGGERVNLLQEIPVATCTTDECGAAASQLRKSMKNTTDPCDDFHEFACGGWLEANPIADHQVSNSVLHQLEDMILKRMDSLLRADPATESEAPIVRKLRNFYSSCNNLTDIDRRGDEPLVELIKELGGWPVLEDPDSSVYNKSWLDLLGKFRELGLPHNMIINLSLRPNPFDPSGSPVWLVLVPPKPSIYNYEHHRIPETSIYYYEMMVESAVMLGAPRDRAEKQMLEALMFEVSLWYLHESEASIKAPQSISTSSIFWSSSLTNYLALMFNGSELFGDGDTTKLWIGPNFALFLGQQMQLTNKRTVANYMIWRVIRNSMQSLSARWRSLADSYSKKLILKEEVPVWKRCLCAMGGAGSEHESLDGLDGGNNLYTGLSALYAKHYPMRKEIAAATQIFDYLKQDLLQNFDNVSWLDEQTRQRLKSKARSLKQLIGYPNELLSEVLIERYYEGLKFDETIDFFANTRRLRKWATEYNLGMLKKPHQLMEQWRSYADLTQISATYDRQSIYLTSGMLERLPRHQNPATKYMDFGSLGFMIGHEMIHAFDNTHRMIDENNQPLRWTSKKSNDTFSEGAKCITDQYSGYVLNETGDNLIGSMVLKEALADGGAIRLAFRTYQRWIEDHGQQVRLPDLPYTPEQLFWIFSASHWCGHDRVRVLNYGIRHTKHPPFKYRVNGPLSNSAEFASSFSCPIGSPMNPEKKCVVW